MNWYRTIKKSAPLPEVTNNYPDTGAWGISDLDEVITEEMKQKLDSERSRAYWGSWIFWSGV